MSIGDNLKKLMYIGIGAAALTEEKVESLVRDLIKKGEITEEEGKKTFAELREKIKENKKELQGKIDQTVKSALKKMHLVTREEYDHLEKRLVALEGSKKQE